MAENKNAQQVREITDKLEQGIKELFESERFKEYLRTMSKFSRIASPPLHLVYLTAVSLSTARRR